MHQSLCYKGFSVSSALIVSLFKKNVIQVQLLNVIDGGLRFKLVSGCHSINNGRKWYS